MIIVIVIVLMLIKMRTKQQTSQQKLDSVAFKLPGIYRLVTARTDILTDCDVDKLRYTNGVHSFRQKF